MREMENHYLPLTIYLTTLCLIFQIALSGSMVRFLPGYDDGPLPFELETGYIGIDESEDIQLFYYFIKSERNPKEDPLLIWLSGGPACSAISGLFFEIGPLAFKGEEYDGSVPPVVLTSYSWTKVASIIFLDSPVGSGFSYAKTPKALQSSDLRRVHRVDQFLRKWLVNHQEFISNPFYVAGDSYAGKIVPAVVQQISQGNEKDVKPTINIQGYLIGNPLMDATVDLNYRIPFAHSMGLISDELYESLRLSCRGEYFNVDPSNSKCLEDVRDYNKSVSRIYEPQILLPYCDMDFVKQKIKSSHRSRDLEEHLGDELLLPSFGCQNYQYVLSAYWANDEEVRRALHVKEGSISEWVRCNGYNISYSRDIPSSFHYHLHNSAKGFRSLIYSGDHDLTIPFLGTQAWIRALNYSIVDDWRPWMRNSQVAGYTRTYANKMTFATIKGGGHTCEYTPEECSVMFQRWINGEPL